MKNPKTKAEEELGFFEELFFSHTWNDDIGMFEREGVRCEAIWFTFLLVLLILLML